MRKALPLLFLVLSLPLFAQTGTFNVTARSSSEVCQASGTVPIACYAYLWQGTTFMGTIYFSDAGTPGVFYRWNFSGQQTGFWQDLYAQTNTTNDTINLSFAAGQGQGSINYSVTPRTCKKVCVRYCYLMCTGPFVKVLGGDVTLP